MNTHGHEDVSKTAGLPLLEDVFGKDKRSLQALYLGNWLTDVSQFVDPVAYWAGSAKVVGIVDGVKEAADNLIEIDFAEAEAEGAYLQFFEQAFEWHQMTYVFYPYFWARKERWPMIQQLQDQDPLYEKFLKAGAARVLVSVRPGFEGAVTHFLDTGSVWGGHGTPDLASPLFVDIVQEIKEQQGAALQEAPVIDRWPARVPTSLVYLQEDATLPDFT